MKNTFTVMHSSGAIAYIDVTFDGKTVQTEHRVIEPQPPAPKEEEKLVILCPFCNAPYTARMEAEFNYSMGSEWTGVYGEEKLVKIYCDNCKRLVYTKEED